MKHSFQIFTTAAALILLAGSTAFAASETWTGTSGNWTATTWSPDGVPPGAVAPSTANADKATFNTSGGGTITVDNGRNIENISFDTGAGSFTLSSGSLVLTSAGTIQLTSGVTSSGATENINTGMTLEGSYTIANNQTGSDILSFGTLGTITNGTTSAATLTLGGTNTGANTIAGVIGNGVGSTAVTKSGAGNWILTGSNDAAGGYTISAGTLQLGSANAGFGTGGGSIAVNSTNGLTFSTITGATFNISALTGSSNEQLQDVGGNAVTLYINNIENTTNQPAKPYTYSGVLSGTGSIIKGGENNQIFSASNTYSGGTTVESFGYGSYFLGGIETTLSSAGPTGNTPFGTGPITVYGGEVIIAPSTSGAAVSLATPSTFTYAGNAELVLKVGTETSLTYTVGTGSGAALIRSGNGSLTINSDATGSYGAATSALGNTEFLEVAAGSTTPALVNSSTMVNPSIVGYVAASSGSVTGVTNTTGTTTANSTETALPATFGIGSPFLGSTVSAISGTPGNWTITLIGNSNVGNATPASVTYTTPAYATFVTYGGSGFAQAAVTNHTTAFTTTAGEIANVTLSAAGAITDSGGNPFAMEINESAANPSPTINGVLTIGSGSGQAGLILNSSVNNAGFISGGTINFGAAEGIITLVGGGGDPSLSAILTGTGGITFTGNDSGPTNPSSTLALNSSTSSPNTFTGGLNIDGNALSTSGTNSSYGDPSNVITINGGGFTSSGSNNMVAGRSVVLGAGGGELGANNTIQVYGWNVSGVGQLLTSAGGNEVLLAGNNTYTGGTLLGAGFTAISSNANIGGASSSIEFGNIYTSGSTTTLSIIGTQLTSFGSHPVDFRYNSDGSNTVGMDIQSPANTFTISQALDIGQAGFVKYGAGTLVLTGGGAYSGTTTLVGGTLQVNEGPTGSLASSTALSFNGGTLDIVGAASGATTQNFGNVTVTGASGATGGGGSSLIVNSNGGGGTTVNLGTLAQSTVAGSALLIDAASSNSVITTTTAPDTTTGTTGGAPGIYGGRVVYENSSGVVNWATSTTGSNPYTLSGYSNYVTLASSSLNSDNAIINGSDTTTIPSYGTPSIFNSFKITNSVAGGQLFLGGAGNPVTLTSGGLLFTGTASYTVGQNATDVLKAGTGSNATNTDLIVQQYGSGALTIAATIANGTGASTLTKAGPGELILTAANTYSGFTYIDGGVLSIDTDSELGTGTTVAINGGTLQATNSITDSRTITLGSNGGTINLTNGSTLTLSGQINSATNGGTSVGVGSLTLTSDANGADTLILSHNNSQFSDGVTIDGGTLETSSGNIITGGNLLTFGTSTATVETLMLNNNAAQVAGLVAGSTNAIIENNTTSGSGVTLTDIQGGNTTYAGTLIDGTVTSTKSLSFLKAGGGTLTLSNTGSSYTGTTEIDNGILNVVNLAVQTGTAGAATSSIGASSNAAGNLIFGGSQATTATLQYTGSTAQTTDRLFTLGDVNGSNGVIDASGSAAAATLSFTNTGAIAIANLTAGSNNSDTHTLTLTGTNTGTATTMNTLAPLLVDAPSETPTVTGTSGATTITVGSNTGLAVNELVSGTGIAVGARIVNINSTTITLSLPNTGTVSGTGAVAGGATSLSKTGTGSWAVTNANTYSGGTTVSAGTLYVNNTTGSGTGLGALNVGAGATLAGTGTIKPTVAGAGIIMAANSTLISGGIQAVVSPTTTAGTGLTLDNRVAAGTILNASIGSVNLTFYLGAGTTGLIGSTAGQLPYVFSNPNTGSTYMTVLGNSTGELAFATGDKITVNDLTAMNLQLNLQVPYLLIQAGTTPDMLSDNNLYSGLVTTGGVSGGNLQNGYVTNLTLAGNTMTEYGGTALYLYNGELEVVPEPGTWAMMLGGLALLIVIQRRRQNKTR